MESNRLAAPPQNGSGSMAPNGHALQNASNGASPERVAYTAPARAVDVVRALLLVELDNFCGVHV